MSFPPATEMFQFAGFASCAYGFSAGYPLRGGLPHSEIPGSTIARISPGLFAACHVLHRLSVPRHPPDALHSRLSATPNGKNHRMRQTLLSEDTYGIRTAKPQGFAGADTASVTQFASSQLSINNRHRRSRDHPATNPFHCRVGCTPPGGGERDRTDDLLLAKQALSQLSYTPVPEDRDPGISNQTCQSRELRTTPKRLMAIRRAPRFLALIPELVGQGGFEPPTSRLSSARSNQLSY
jgi:hypothetical protein